MSSQITDEVARKAIEQALLAAGGTCDTPEYMLASDPAARELRALLDAEPCTSCDGYGEYIDAIGDWRGYCTCPAGVDKKDMHERPLP